MTPTPLDFRPFEADIILRTFTVQDLVQLYADTMGIAPLQVHCHDAGDNITLAVREDLAPGLMVEIGATSTYTINHLLRLSRTSNTMCVISPDKSIFEPLYDAFGELLALTRLKKLNHLL